MSLQGKRFQRFVTSSKLRDASSWRLAGFLKLHEKFSYRLVASLDLRDVTL